MRKEFIIKSRDSDKDRKSFATGAKYFKSHIKRKSVSWGVTFLVMKL